MLFLKAKEHLVWIQGNVSREMDWKWMEIALSVARGESSEMAWNWPGMGMRWAILKFIYNFKVWGYKQSSL